MKRLFTSSLLACLFALSSAWTQVCLIQNLVGGSSNSEIIANGLGQSFTTSCGSGNFETLTFSNTGLGSVSSVRLEIYEGSGYGGTLLFSMEPLDWDASDPTAIILNLETCSSNSGATPTCSGNLAYASGQVYTFRFLATAGGNFTLLKNTTDTYAGGQFLNNSGTPNGTQDLVFILQTDGSLLPVELTFFQAQLHENQTHLTWRTASEKDNAGFEIERSSDGSDWRTLDFVPGNGTTNQPQEYTFTDENPLPGDNYYRLKQLDFSGAFEYSDARHVRFSSGKLDNVLVSPNPVQAGQALTVHLGGAEVESVQLVDVLGRIAWEGRQLEGEKLEISMPQDLSKGLCWLVLESGGERVVRKVFVQ